MDFKKHSTVHEHEQEGIEVITFQHKTRKTKKERERSGAKLTGKELKKTNLETRDIVRGQC